MNLDVIYELSRAIDLVSGDQGIKVVIITGSGERSFCAGADISYMVILILLLPKDMLHRHNLC